MSFYERWVLPRLLDAAMAFPALNEERRACLSTARGQVLEVGFGTGRNLPFYPDEVERVVALDPSAASARLARQRIARARFPVEYLCMTGENMVVPDHTFDFVVSTFTLCSIPDPTAALQLATWLQHSPQLL